MKQKSEQKISVADLVNCDRGCIKYKLFDVLKYNTMMDMFYSKTKKTQIINIQQTESDFFKELKSETSIVFQTM